MAKDKITEYDATANNNTVVGDVNLAENSALPSDMNNAIREIMSHQKEAFGSGTPLFVDQTNNRVGVNKTPTVALDVSGDITFTGDLASSTSGTSNFRAGVNAGDAIASGGNYNVVIGDEAGTALSTGDSNVAIGFEALKTEDANGFNVAIGYQALKTQDAGADAQNTAIGYKAGTAITTGIQNTLMGSNTAIALNDADFNTAIGQQALLQDTKGNKTTAIGHGALGTQNFTSSTDSNNTALGFSAGASITTGLNNTLIGSLTGDGITTGDRNTALGYRSLSGAVDDGQYNTCVGSDAGLVTTGDQNTFVGAYDPSTGGSGAEVTTGSKNTILGSYNGNQGSLDIRTSSNNIVLSDGDGNPRLILDGDGKLFVGTTTTSLTGVSGLTVQLGGSGNTIGLTTVSQLGGVPFIANRNTDDGTVIQIRQNNGTEGSISVSGSTTSYNAFSGSHWSRLSDNSKPTILKGTVIENIDEMCDWYRVKFTVAKTEEKEEYVESISIALPNGKKEGDTISYTHEGITYDDAVLVKEDDNKHTKCKISDTADSKRVYGVFADWDNDDDTVNDMYVTALGTHVVRINKDVTVQSGDLLSSNGDGTAKVQDDDIIRSKTIGKVLTNIKQETYSDGSYTVPCALYCG